MFRTVKITVILIWTFRIVVHQVCAKIIVPKQGRFISFIKIDGLIVYVILTWVRAIAIQFMNQTFLLIFIGISPSAILILACLSTLAFIVAVASSLIQCCSLSLL